MFKFFKSALAPKTTPLPEDELQEIFCKLSQWKPEHLLGLRYRLNHLYDSLEVEQRLTTYLVARMNNPESIKFEEHLGFLEKLFEMERRFEEKKMPVEAISAKLIALDYACHTVSYANIASALNRKRSMSIFREFRATGVVDLNPRRGHLSPPPP